ncbi:MAG: hypothetical protein Q9199_004502 [Rusavskia elegans]
MPGTIIITAANSCLAIPAVQHLLTDYPGYTAVLTVRNMDTDVNTKRLRAIIAKHPDAKTSVHELDLADLRLYMISRAILYCRRDSKGQPPPLASLICNAFHWNLSGGVETTKDGYEKSLQVNHVAYATLVLRLLRSFGPDGGRIVLFSSDAHWPGEERSRELLRPLLRFMDPTTRTAAEAGFDVVDLATRAAYPQERGYFPLLKPDVSAPDTLVEESQQRL